VLVNLTVVLGIEIMAQNADHHTQKITINKKTVKVSSLRDEEYPKAVKKDGKYVLPWEATGAPPDKVTNFRYFFTIDGSGVPNEKKLDEEPLVQRMAADPNRIDNPPEHGIRTTWLGHASVLFQLDNVNILVNPNFNQRGIKYYHPGDDKRYRQPVYKVDDLPRIDCVFITNTHFDYLDKTSVCLLNERFGEMLLWYVPMGVADWMNKAGCVTVVELDWWKEDEVDFIDHTKLNDENEDTKTTTFNIACTPSQSYHSRAFDDDNGVLWCSWVIISPRYKLFISGATGYCSIFKSIGKRYGPFHMAAIPIGGYDPDWKFAYGNVTPEQAVQIHQDVLAMCSLALSWGTFTISNEHYLEPPKRLNEELKKQGLSEMQFFLLKHGESRLVEIKEADKDNSGSDHEHIQVDAVVNGHAHVVEKADSCSDEEKESVEITADSHMHAGTVEITTTQTTIVNGETVDEHTETHTDTTFDIDGIVTHTETVTIDGETHVHEHEQKDELEGDAGLLQQLVDNFVEESQHAEVDGHADVHVDISYGGGFTYDHDDN